MINELIVKNMLRQLGICKGYIGYDYIVHAIGLMFFNEGFLSCLTKNLYVTIAKNYNTSSACVEKNIRSIIFIIWNNPNNQYLIEKYFGEKYIYQKPSNKEFLAMLYEYIDSYEILKEVFNINKFICPFSTSVCSVYDNIVDSLRKLQ